MFGVRHGPWHRLCGYFGSTCCMCPAPRFPGIPWTLAHVRLWQEALHVLWDWWHTMCSCGLENRCRRTARRHGAQMEAELFQRAGQCCVLGSPFVKPELKQVAEVWMQWESGERVNRAVKIGAILRSLSQVSIGGRCSPCTACCICVLWVFLSGALQTHTEVCFKEQFLF